eukprot:108166_1
MRTWQSKQSQNIVNIDVFDNKHALSDIVGGFSEYLDEKRDWFEDTIYKKGLNSAHQKIQYYFANSAWSPFQKANSLDAHSNANDIENPIKQIPTYQSTRPHYITIYSPYVIKGLPALKSWMNEGHGLLWENSEKQIFEEIIQCNNLYREALFNAIWNSNYFHCLDTKKIHGNTTFSFGTEAFLEIDDKINFIYNNQELCSVNMMISGANMLLETESKIGKAWLAYCERPGEFSNSTASNFKDTITIGKARLCVGAALTFLESIPSNNCVFETLYGVINNDSNSFW